MPGEDEGFVETVLRAGQETGQTGFDPARLDGMARLGESRAQQRLDFVVAFQAVRQERAKRLDKRRRIIEDGR